ncbi:helix-turn-helix domain-containing protein [Paraburkholderia azotifigens]|uniref:helix-turn-helix domain-containing protein n=1 Tax=Paraburkholderia azotifigens TaxID=2057004 RepID=UPI0031752818
MGKRLSPAQWDAVRRRHVDGGESAKVIARAFGISHYSIYKRCARDHWRANPDTPGLIASDSLADVVSRLERVAERFEAVLVTEVLR